MQQKVNEVVLSLSGELLTLNNVSVIETQDGIYIEDSFKKGTDNEGNDLVQRRLTYYRSERVVKLVWQEDALVDTVKENVIAELIQDKFEHLMDIYEDEDEDQRDNPEFNPYKKE